MDAVTRAYELSSGDIFGLGDRIYRFSNGYFAEQIISGYDEIGYTYKDNGKVFNREQVNKNFAREMENKKMSNKLELTEYQKTILKNQIKETSYFNNGKTTVVIATMKNGFEIVGTSSCVHRENFDMAMGRHYALVDALRQMDGYIGFGRQQEAYEQKQYLKEQEEIDAELQKIRKENHVSLGFNGEGIKTFEVKPNWHGQAVIVNTADLGRISHLPLESTIFNEPTKNSDALNKIPSRSKTVEALKDDLVTKSNKVFGVELYVD